jgi:hypothetical protein
MNEREIEELVNQIQRLQIEQTELITRLTRERAVPAVGAAQGTAALQTTATTRPRPFRIGDRVKIRNPRIYQPSTATVTKIGAVQITVTTRNGVKIYRIPENLILIEE